MFTYPNVDIIGDRVFLRYMRMWPILLTTKKKRKRDALPRMWPKYEEREAGMSGEIVTRIYPLEWFYE